MQKPRTSRVPVETLTDDLSAMDLAFAHAKDFEFSDPEDIQRIQIVVMQLAEYLHERGHTLAWEELDPRGFFARVAFMSDHEQVGVAQILMGFYVWLGCNQLAPADACLDILQGIAGGFPQAPHLELLSRLAQPLLGHLSSLAHFN